MNRREQVYQFFTFITNSGYVDNFIYQMPFQYNYVDLQSIEPVTKGVSFSKKYELLFYVTPQKSWHKIEVLDTGTEFKVSTPVGYASYTSLEFSNVDFAVDKLISEIKGVNNGEFLLEPLMLKIYRSINFILQKFIREANFAFVLDSSMYNGVTTAHGYYEAGTEVLKFTLQYSVLHGEFVMRDELGTTMLEVKHSVANSITSLASKLEGS